MLLLAVLARIEQPALALAWAAMLLAMILVQLVTIAGTAWLASKQPPLIYLPDGPQRRPPLPSPRCTGNSSWAPKWLIVVDIIWR